jgi:subtilisin family serine protease
MRRVRAASVVVLLLLVAAPSVAAWATSPRADQWGLERIRAPEAWAAARGAGTVVAVVDTGVHLTHPDLAPRLLRDRGGRVVGLDLVDGGAPHDEQGHGTLVAGVIAAATDAGVGGPGMAGVAPDARLIPIRVLDRDGRGRVSDVDTGIRWAVDNGADVVNLSLESMAPLPGDVLSSGLDGAVRYAWERGVVVVAAAGNSGTPFTDFRSSTPVLLVGATDRNDRRATFSDGGRSDMVMAPGVDIVSTACSPCRDGGGAGYGRASGTSFAAPHVAGAVAVLRSAGLSHTDAVARLRDTAARIEGGGLVATGHGRIDLAAAIGVGSTSRPSPTPSPTASPAPRTSPSPRSSEPAAPSDPSGPAASTGPEGGTDPAGGGLAPDVSRSDPPDGSPPDDATSSAATPRPPADGPAEDGPDPGDQDVLEGPQQGGTEAGRFGAPTPTPPGDGLDPVDIEVRLPRRLGALEGMAAALVAVSGAAVVGARRVR